MRRVSWLGAVITVCCQQGYGNGILLTLPSPSAFADGEAFAEAALPAPDPSARELRVTLTFDASPTNNVEFCLGNDDGDGMGVAAGWDCGGEWFARGGRFLSEWLAAPAANPAAAGQRTLTLRVRFLRGGALAGAALEADGEPVSFAGHEGDLAAWLAPLRFGGLRAAVTARGDYGGVSMRAAFIKDGSVITVR